MKGSGCFARLAPEACFVPAACFPCLCRSTPRRSQGGVETNTSPHSAKTLGNLHELDCRSPSACPLAFGRVSARSGLETLKQLQ